MINTKILLDPGHGVPHTGAAGKTRGVQERIVVLDVCLALKNWLAARGHAIYLTRSTPLCLVKTDRSSDLLARAVMAARVGAQCLVSIHCNSATIPSANGYECFTLPGQNISDSLATELLRSYGAMFPNMRLRADMRDGDPDQEKDLMVLRKTAPNIAAVLFELAFLSNPAEEAFLDDGQNYQNIAAALGRGIINWGKNMRYC